MALNLRHAMASSFAQRDLISSTVESKAVPFQKAGEPYATVARARRAQTLKEAMMTDDWKAVSD